jgi:hypothetical protein
VVIVRGKLSVVATPDTDTKRGGIGCGPDPIKQLFGFTRVPAKKNRALTAPYCLRPIWTMAGVDYLGRCVRRVS